MVSLKIFIFLKAFFSTFFALGTTGGIHRLSNRIYLNDVLYVSEFSIEKCIFNLFDIIILLTISRYRDML